jgi:hypothetical protein
MNAEDAGMTREMLKTASPLRYNLAHVYFSAEVPVNGRAKEERELFIQPGGGFAYLVVDNYPNNFTFDQIQAKIYKTVNGTEQYFDSQTYNISMSYYFTYVKYTFYSYGNYIFDIFDKFGNVLGTTTVTISPAANTNSSGTNNIDCGSEYKQYYNSSLRMSLCIPKNCYTEESQSGDDAIKLKNYYSKDVPISFMQEPAEGMERFDAKVSDIARDILLKSAVYKSYQRTEFVLLSPIRTDLDVYRSTVMGITTAGDTLQNAHYYIKFIGFKIRGHDCMTITSPFVSPTVNLLDRIIIESGMLKTLKVYL